MAISMAFKRTVGQKFIFYNMSTSTTPPKRKQRAREVGRFPLLHLAGPPTAGGPHNDGLFDPLKMANFGIYVSFLGV